MLTISNRQVILTCPFNEYQKIEGISFSDIKQEGKDKFEPTEKMQLGTRVHNYLLTPEEYKYEDIEIVKPLALEIKKRIGGLFEFLIPEFVVSSDFTFQNFTMRHRGRVDLGIPGRIIIDLKVTSMPLHSMMKFFDSPSQVSGYALSADCPLAFILGIHPKTKETKLYKIDIRQEWWASQVLQRGKAIL